MSKGSGRSENTRCILFMVLAMAGFAVEDAVIKQLSYDMPISQVLMMIGAGGLAAFSAVCLAIGHNPFQAVVLTRWFVLRTACELMSAILFVCAIVYASLSASSAILQATPLAVALGGLLFLKQSVSLRQWVLIGLGFFGVVLVIQPGSEAFAPATLWAVLGVFFLAARDLVTRWMSLSVAPLTVSFWAFFALWLAGLVTVPLFGEFVAIEARHWALWSLSSLAGAGAYWAVVLATRGGDVAVVAPFRYSRLVFALGLSVIYFDESFTWPMLLGSAFIVGSGLLSLQRKRSKMAI